MMRRPGNKFPRLLLVLLLAAGIAGCTPRLSPLYRDYEVPEALQESPEVYAKIRTALQEAGWEIVPSDVPNVVKTEEQTLTNWGLYRVTAYLEAASLGGDYVRVYIHPYRKYITGGRNKLPFLLRSVRTKVLPALNSALEAQGLHGVGVPRDRDEEVIAAQK